MTTAKTSDPNSVRPSTLNEMVFQGLRADILSGELPAGRRLRFAEMRKRYNTSAGVVREALARLTEQGLVRAEPQLGFSVISVSGSDLEDLTDARCDIEGLAFKYSILNGDIEWESTVVAKHHNLIRTPTHLDEEKTIFNEEWSVAHKQFHLALLNGGHNRRLKNIAISMRDEAEVYRRAVVRRPVGSDQHRDTVAEHAALTEAAINRDVETGVAAIVNHIRATTNFLLQQQEWDSGHEHE